MQQRARSAALHFGILGIGRGSWFARAMAHAAGAELNALCARHPDRLQRLADTLPAKVDVFTSYDRMLASSIDAVIVASGPADHVRHSLQALQAGKHVLSEVPAATTLDDARALLDGVRRSGLKYMLAENFCYMRSWSLVKQLVKQGVFGEPVFGEGRLLAPIDFAPPDKAQRWNTAEWAMHRGHPYATHYWGPLYQVFGEPLQTVTCLGSGQHHKPWARADDTSVVLGNTPGGKLIQLRVDFFNPAPTEGYIGLHGTQGCCRILSTGKDADQKIHVRGVTPKHEWQSLWDFDQHLGDEWKAVPHELLERGYDSGLSLLIQDFAQAVLDNTDTPINVTDALAMSVPGIVSETARDRGGVPVTVPCFAS